jgi:hypothetical protein
MYLNVILTIFVVLQITTLILIYKWWKKYGRTLFKTFTQMKSMSSGGLNLGQMPDIGAMMKQFENITKNMGKK